MSNAYDVIVIGSGAGGGTLVHTLAPSGKRILLLERGDYVRREKENWDSRAVNVNGRYQTKEIWKDLDGRDLHPHTNYAVGGNTKFYGAALFRLRKADFGELQHHGGMSPAWPVTYDEMEPYYSRAERMYHVHGERGEDPTDPYASEPYPHPAVSHETRLQHLAEDFARSGLHLRLTEDVRPALLGRRILVDVRQEHCNARDRAEFLHPGKRDRHLGPDLERWQPQQRQLPHADHQRVELHLAGFLARLGRGAGPLLTLSPAPWLSP